MNKKTIIAVVALVLVVAALLGVYLAARPQTQEGVKTITVTVVHKDKTEVVKTIHTDEEYLAQVMIAEGLIAADNIQNGMFDTVDGETAVWAEDEGWWAIYEGDAMSNLGIEEIPVADGKAYRFVYTNGFAS